MLDAEFLTAIANTADLSFKAEIPPPVRLAKRPSMSKTKGFYRPGERAEDGAPFELVPTKSPYYRGQPMDRLRRAPSTSEEKAVWRLEAEYLAGRLGKNSVENSSHWDCALWIERLWETAMKPPNAAQGLSLVTAPTDEEVCHSRYSNDSTNLQVVRELPTATFAALYMVTAVQAADKVLQKQLIAPKSERQRPVFDSALYWAEQRLDADKTIRMLMAGMRTLWSPVKLSIIDRIELNALGTTQGVGSNGATAAGRQRVIEGLRIACSIRKDLLRAELTGNPRILPLNYAAQEMRGVLERQAVAELREIRGQQRCTAQKLLNAA